MLPVTVLLADLIGFYELLVFIWALSSWFPEWRGKPWMRTLHDIVWPYVGLFARLNLRAGMVDLSAMLALILLDLFRTALLHSGRGI